MSKNKKQSEFARGYDWGKVNSVTQIYNYIAKLDNSKMKKDIIKYIKDNFDGFIMSYGKTKPTKFEKKFCHFDTIVYRGFKVPIYDDDCGQQSYFYFNNCSHSCGSYNLDHEGYVQYVIDEYLDNICDLHSIKFEYIGGFIRFANHEHTEITFTYRSEELKHYYNINESTYNKEDIIKECCEILDTLFASEDFQKAEAERKSRGDLYFNEMIESMKGEE